MPKFVLILMVRNEERILKRCLTAVEGVVDAFCIHDTGSKDKTCEIAVEFLKDHKGCLSGSEWVNFGHNRTASFVAAQKYVKEQLEWDLADTYGLLLDADMVFVPNTLLEHPLTEKGYTIVQCAGSLEYPNTRLVRMDYDWRCIGVTHEYWSGPTAPLSKSVCYINDQNDGGCKSDKFERDQRLLEKGLEEDPTNVRYMFYLAQTYHCLGRYKDAIRMYKKRIAGGSWDEEVWYSHYMIGDSHYKLGNFIKFEEWMMRAYEKRPSRAESLYRLVKHFRETSQHYKGWHYLLKALAIPDSTDSLFVEKDVYDYLLKYEQTVLQYYVSKDKVEGLKNTVEFLMNHDYGNVLSNMQFYVDPVGTSKPLNIPRDFFGSDFHPGSVCMWTQNGNLFANIRYVNYRLDPQHRTTYEMSENGVYSTNHTVRTQNAYYDFQTGNLVAMKDDTVLLPRRDCHIRGLEDVRVFQKDKDLYMTATTLEFSPNIQILYGKYHTDGSYSDCRILESPFGQQCEKNWLGVSGTDDMIYGWYPLRIGTIEGNQLKIHTEHPTPKFFSKLRGSAPPLRIGDELWTLVHLVEYSSPRKYYHLFVVLDAKTYSVRRMSLPFVFRNATVEYCLGVVLTERGFECVYSSMDDNPERLAIESKNLHWVDL